MTSVPNDPLFDYELPMRLGGGEFGTPGSGYMARDAWTLFLPALVKRIPDALSDLLSEETLGIARQCGPDPLRRPSPYLDRDHELWGCVRRWCASMNIAFTNDDSFIVACESVANTIFRAVRASDNGEPLPTSFAKPLRIFTTVTSFNDDGTIDAGGGTALAPHFLEPAVASHVFRWAMEVEPEQRALKRMLDAVKADLKRAMAEAKAEALAAGAAHVKVKKEPRHFDWTVRAVVLDERYLTIANAEEPEEPVDVKAVERAVKETCEALGIRAPNHGPGRPPGR